MLLNFTRVELLALMGAENMITGHNESPETGM